jgi:hypothetical protein
MSKEEISICGVIIYITDSVHHIMFEDNKALTEHCILGTGSVPTLRIRITFTPIQLGQADKGAEVVLSAGTRKSWC